MTFTVTYIANGEQTVVPVTTEKDLTFAEAEAVGKMGVEQYNQEKAAHMPIHTFVRVEGEFIEPQQESVASEAPKGKRTKK